MSAVYKMPYTKGNTNTAAALSYVRNNMFTSGNGDRGDVPNVVFVITDGGSNNKKDTQNEAYKVSVHDTGDAATFCLCETYRIYYIYHAVGCAC